MVSGLVNINLNTRGLYKGLLPNKHKKRSKEVLKAQKFNETSQQCSISNSEIAWEMLFFFLVKNKKTLLGLEIKLLWLVLVSLVFNTFNCVNIFIKCP